MTDKDSVPVITGDLRTGEYLKLLSGRAVAVVANQTSMAGKTHIVDTLVSLGVYLRVIFAPEHGFRNMADAGETISDSRDQSTGIKIISLYGTHSKPAGGDLSGIDVVLFDIQDVGTRFYTYISTLTLVMESCANEGKLCVVLDRPNPNGFFVDGNILDTAYKSFVGMHPVPVVHGMTVGEYAMMVNGEGWLEGGKRCNLVVVPCINYSHSRFYKLPVRPSPNLPDQNSVWLYPTLCFFEGTALSCGRGTPFPFEVFGSPEMPDKGFSFTPRSGPGSKSPMYKDKVCFGVDLRDATTRGLVPAGRINLQWIIEAYRDYPDKPKFFNSYFDTLAGGPVLRQQIEKGMSAEEIRATWAGGIEKFMKIRAKYLLYR
ncbi:MAG TPA: DUF1343 domain-containing protein [Bacteroidales bacterium]|nr:DUF1343 domain-containing protein [Bacteroidales bacterium]